MKSGALSFRVKGEEYQGLWHADFAQRAELVKKNWK